MKRTFLVLAVLAAATAVGVAYGAIPAANGTISACADAQGRLKVIDAEAGQTCPSGQKPLAWRQQGSGIAGYEQVASASTSDSSWFKARTAKCPSGKIAVGGGAEAFYLTSSGEFDLKELAIANSTPSNSGPGWYAEAHEVVPTSTAWQLRVWAICVTAD